MDLDPVDHGYQAANAAARGLLMGVANEVVQLLLQSAGSWLFEGLRSGLSDSEWSALRFLARANEFSRTPSALTAFLDTHRSAAAQIAAILQSKGLVVRKPSSYDKRSITLSVTREGEKFLERDPINALREQIVALEDENRSQLRNSLREILIRLDVAQRRQNADVCSQCLFLVENDEGKHRHFNCRFFRRSVAPRDTSLLCTYFEPRPQKSLAAKTSTA